MAQLRFREAQGRDFEDLGIRGTALQKDFREADEEKITDVIPEEFIEDSIEILLSIADCLDEGMSVAYAYSDSVLYVRIFDGERYVFPLPFMLTEDADLTDACRNLSLYTRRELIPLIISDVPREELEVLTELFRYLDASCYTDDEDTFFVKVNNECDECDELPTLELDGIIFDALTEADDASYAELCRDRELNKFWGYDVNEDEPDAEPSYYRSVALREFADGVAMTFAVRFEGELAGEATIYDFDYFGSAAIAVRVLPAFHGKGIGSRSVRGLIEIAGGIGLRELRTEIMNDNTSSIKMTSKYMNLDSVGESKTKFTLQL